MIRKFRRSFGWLHDFMTYGFGLEMSLGILEYLDNHNIISAVITFIFDSLAGYHILTSRILWKCFGTIREVSMAYQVRKQDLVGIYFEPHMLPNLFNPPSQFTHTNTHQDHNQEGIGQYHGKDSNNDARFSVTNSRQFTYCSKQWILYQSMFDL